MLGAIKFFRTSLCIMKLLRNALSDLCAFALLYVKDQTTETMKASFIDTKKMIK